MVSWRAQWGPRGSGEDQWSHKGLSGSQQVWGGLGRRLRVSGVLMVSQVESAQSPNGFGWHSSGGGCSVEYP